VTVERFRDQGVVLGTVDYGEADRLVTLLTRSHGKLTAFAAGARKSRRRFAGALEPCTVLSVELVERRGTTFRLDTADIQNPFARIRNDLRRISRSLYALELVRELTREREPQERLLELLLRYLDGLDAGESGPTSLLAFELDALAHAGLMPRLAGCALCGGGWADHPRFDPEHGGAVCEACAPRSFRAAAVSPGLLSALRGLQEGSRTPLPAEARQHARALLNGFISHHLGRRLRSADFMDQVGLD
jgi:DNA repair protein RecO (recombination protein O)